MNLRSSVSDRVALEIGAMRLVAVEWGAVLLLQLSFAVDAEMCAQLSVCKCAIVRNRMTASTAVRSADRHPKQHGTMGRIALFKSRRPAI